MCQRSLLCSPSGGGVGWRAVTSEGRNRAQSEGGSDVGEEGEGRKAKTF